MLLITSLYFHFIYDKFEVNFHAQGMGNQQGEEQDVSTTGDDLTVSSDNVREICDIAQSQSRFGSVLSGELDFECESQRSEGDLDWYTESRGPGCPGYGITPPCVPSLVIIRQIGEGT